MAAIALAIAARRHANDVLGLGNALRISARVNWQQGNAATADGQS